jgi:hypothetical protein
MQDYTPTAGRITTISCPQDGVDLRRVLTVNTPLQTLADGVAQAQDELDGVAEALGLLPGIGDSYPITQIAIPAYGGAFKSAKFELSSFFEYSEGMVQIGTGTGGVDLAVPLQCLPLVGEIVGYQVMLAGNGNIGTSDPHTSVPEYPIITELIRRSLTGGVTVIASTAESSGQTPAGYDSIHLQNGGAAHNISYQDASNEPAFYYIGVRGEHGTGALNNTTTIYGFSIFFRGTAL